MAITEIMLDRQAPGRLFVGGEWVDPVEGRTFETRFPATGEVLAEVAEAGPADVAAGVTAARQAFESGPGPRMDAADRGALLWQLAGAGEGRSQAPVRLEVRDNGKPYREATIDIQQTVDAVRYYAGCATKPE